jgi:hypothetical protein
MSLNGLPSSLSPDAAKCLSNGLNRDVLVLWTTRFFRWLSAWWGFLSSCLCFAAPAADEVRAAVEGFADGGHSAARLARPRQRGSLQLQGAAAPTLTGSTVTTTARM